MRDADRFKAELAGGQQPENHYVFVRTDRGTLGDCQYIEVRESNAGNGIFFPRAPMTPEVYRRLDQKWTEHNRQHRELEIDEDHNPQI